MAYAGRLMLQKLKSQCRFEVVAVTPISGGASARSNAQNQATTIFQEIVNMGVNAERVSLSSRTNAEASSPEVQIFVR